MSHVAPSADPSSDGQDHGSPTTTRINPVDWSGRLGHDLGQVRTHVTSLMAIGGQRPVDAQGRLLHEGDMASQLALTLANLGDVLRLAGMGLTDLVQMRIYTTHLEALHDARFVLSEHLAEQGATPPITTLEVARLSIPGMAVELDGLAVRSQPPSEGNPA